MRNYNDLLKNSYTVANDLLIEGETSNLSNSTFDSNITHSYTFINDSFYQ